VFSTEAARLTQPGHPSVGRRNEYRRRLRRPALGKKRLGLTNLRRLMSLPPSYSAQNFAVMYIKDFSE